ncbi:MAG TPA: class I SAM-dependent methyltransferase [Anaerolineae bacterium]|jgi:O-methyltransferase involved in polyketide biosynthesis|nr:class I SAM-dependent methyltransferase [Anaerolineae bacterium]
MTDYKEKIQLTEEQETLLVPLYSKAIEGQQPNPIFIDKKAQEILEHIEYDFAKLKIPRKTAVMLSIRAKKIDAYTREFLASHPRGVVIHLGCGLDSRYTRVNNGEVEWYDLDLPAVIDLRRKFYKETAMYHMISSSVTDLGWIDTISPRGRPVLVIAEGLLMYLKEEEIKALILKLKEAFPGCGLVFDAFSVLTAKRVKKHPSIKRTGAVVQWGIDDATMIEQWAEGIRLREEWYFTQSEDIEKLGFGYRLSFRVAGLFTAAKKAHRILYYNLL